MRRSPYLRFERGEGDPTSHETGNSRDETIRDVVETLLRQRRMANAGLHRSTKDAVFTLTQAAFLARELGAWAAKQLGIVLSPTDYEKLPPDERRSIITVSLSFQLPVLQPQARAELLHGLAALNVGETVPLLEKNRTGRRRAAPSLVAEAEFGILKWIRWQHGLGRKVADIEAEVAAKAGCTPTLFQKWKKELARIFGEDFVRTRLVCVEELGRHEARFGRRVRSFGTDDNLVRWMEAETLERDLDVLVAKRRAGTQKRRKPS